MAYSTPVVARHVVTSLALMSAVAGIVWLAIIQKHELATDVLLGWTIVMFIINILGLIVFTFVKPDKLSSNNVNLDKIEYMASTPYQILVGLGVIFNITVISAMVYFDMPWYAGAWTVGAITSIHCANWSHRVKARMDELVFENLKTSHL